MRMEPVLEDLEAAASKMGVKVTYELLTDTIAGGGLCKVNGAYRVIIDKRGTVGEKAVTLAKALATLGTEAVFLTPLARDLVEKQRA